MAKIIVCFDEIGGIAEFNGKPLILCTDLILNKATKFLEETLPVANFDDMIDWGNCLVNFDARKIEFVINLRPDGFYVIIEF